MRVHVRMSPRDAGEDHRAATPLELFFDLTFVIAIVEASSSLHHGLVGGHPGHAIATYPLVFFAVWWAWMNLTWFASAYDTDDALYRLAVFVQMTGVLILAAGVHSVFAGEEFGVMTLGYVVMRLGMVALWLRAALSDPPGRACALRYALGISVLQVGWVLRLALPASWEQVSFVVLAIGELCVPIWAERVGRTSWHPRHIAERYGLFTIIVLGELLLSAAIAVQTAIDNDSSFGELATIVVGGLLIVFSMWWVYFDMPAERLVESVRESFEERVSGAFAWGYGHVFVFASAAASGAGLAVAVDQATGHSALTDRQAAWTLTVPVTVYLVSVWLIHARHKPPSLLRNVGVPVGAAAILATSFTGEPVLLTGIVMTLLVLVSLLPGEGGSRKAQNSMTSNSVAASTPSRGPDASAASRTN
jgi:low temperature requirement protein LtrA